MTETAKPEPKFINTHKTPIMVSDPRSGIVHVEPYLPEGDHRRRPDRTYEVVGEWYARHAREVGGPLSPFPVSVGESPVAPAPVSIPVVEPVVVPPAPVVELENSGAVEDDGEDDAEIEEADSTESLDPDATVIIAPVTEEKAVVEETPVKVKAKIALNASKRK